MSRMPDSEYNEYMKRIQNWGLDKDALQRMYDDIYYKYDDGHDMLCRLDKYQSKWTMNLH